MMLLSGTLALPDRVLTPGVVAIEGETIADVRPGPPGSPQQYVVPGFVDVHVHGIRGIDTLDRGGANPIAAMAAALPQYGVTAFCPTTIACEPDALGEMLGQLRAARAGEAAGSARILPAHLESNFINPEYRGAQPAGCLRSPRAALRPAFAERDDAAAGDLLGVVERARGDVGIVTLAPELEGGLDLVRWLAGRGYRVSLGHSGATYEQALDAIAAGARHATHLFNRMPPIGHRAPGLAGAILRSEAVAAEIICDGHHVHPALVHTTIAAKGPAKVMAITDGTALSGLGEGARATLGGQPIVASDTVALLPDGTIAGSLLTMDRAFRNLVTGMGLTLVEAALVCSTTPARELGLPELGRLEAGARADVVVLDEQWSVLQTYIGGQLAYSRY
jgi:N-acetylglucosamine-6-phosphate deacetylase